MMEVKNITEYVSVSFHFNSKRILLSLHDKAGSSDL